MRMMLDFIQLAISAVLVFITWRYVVFTQKIMTAAVDQARAANTAALLAIHQWRFQQVQKLLPIKLAISAANDRLAQFERCVAYHDDALAEIRLYNADLETALVLATTTASAIAINLAEAIQILRNGDEQVAKMVREPGFWSEAEVEAITALIRIAATKLHIAQSWLEPLLKPVENVAYPTDEAVAELVKKLGA